MCWLLLCRCRSVPRLHTDGGPRRAVIRHVLLVGEGARGGAGPHGRLGLEPDSSAPHLPARLPAQQPTHLHASPTRPPTRLTHLPACPPARLPAGYITTSRPRSAPACTRSRRRQPHRWCGRRRLQGVTVAHTPPSHAAPWMHSTAPTGAAHACAPCSCARVAPYCSAPRVVPPLAAGPGRRAGGCVGVAAHLPTRCHQDPRAGACGFASGRQLHGACRHCFLPLALLALAAAAATGDADG